MSCKYSIAALKGFAHLCSLNDIPYDFTAATNVQSLKKIVKLYTSGVFFDQSFWFMCFDLSILFEILCLSFFFTPHFNMDKTESRIVDSTKTPFMSSAAREMKAICFWSLWLCRQYQQFKCILFVAERLHWPVHALVHYVLIMTSASVAHRICLFCLPGYTWGCVSGRRWKESIHGHSVCVLFYWRSANSHQSLCVSFSRTYCLKNRIKGNKDPSLDAPTPSLLNSHANRLGESTHHEW